MHVGPVSDTTYSSQQRQFVVDIEAINGPGGPLVESGRKIRGAATDQAGPGMEYLMLCRVFLLTGPDRNPNGSGRVEQRPDLKQVGPK